MSDKIFHVIIAEDENLIAKNIARHIEEDNPHFKVTGIYSNGEDAFEAVMAKPPAVVFTDISMPVMTGLELAERIQHEMNSVKCVIITGYADFEYAREAIRYGVEDYLLKPVDKEELHKVLKNLELSLTDLSDQIRTGEGEDTSLTPEEIVTLVKDHIKKNYKEELDLNTISQNLGFSSSYLTKLFNKLENTTPSKYIRNYRMGIARQLMEDKSLTIQQIASAVGYNDPFHFSRSFKQTFGITPTEYRADPGQ
ncbi:MAG: response regulator [Lachnospiraceae bacterium]|nr:response regulator [Lachnospiraceae bacterium]